MVKNNFSSLSVLVSDAHSRKGYDVFNIISNKYKYKTLLVSDKNIKRLSLIYLQKVYILRTSDYKLFEKDLLDITHQVKSQIVYLPVLT